MARHKHADAIHLWAEGVELQWREHSCLAWIDEAELNPNFNCGGEFRAKPRIVKREGWVNIYRAYGCENPSAATVHATEEAAKTFASIGLVATLKVEWEEEE